MNALSLSESIPRIDSGKRPAITSSASVTRVCSRTSSKIASTQPVATSVTDSVWMKDQNIFPPQWAAKSISR